MSRLFIAKGHKDASQLFVIIFQPEIGYNYLLPHLLMARARVNFVKNIKGRDTQYVFLFIYCEI